jgi:hypothetical protein
MRKPRVPVLVDRDAYDVFKAYSDAVLERRLECLTRREQ